MWLFSVLGLMKSFREALHLENAEELVEVLKKDLSGPAQKKS